MRPALIPVALLLKQAAAALALLAAATCPAMAEPPTLDAASGSDLFARFCASCHGDLGRGDGPVAPLLKAVVPDLTAISSRAGGRFPEDRVREIIDGRAAVPAHGARTMPVWGYEFEARVPDETPGRAGASAATGKLVTYLRSIQR